MNEILGRWKRLPVITRTLVLLVPIQFILWAMVGRTTFGASAFESMQFSSVALFEGELWRSMTYLLLEDIRSPLSFIFTTIIIYFAGRDLEKLWGTPRFAKALVFISLGGIISASVMGGLGIHSHAFGWSLIAFYGLIAAWGMVFRDKQILLFMVIPMTGQMITILTGIYLVLQAVALNTFPWTLAIGHFVVAILLTSSVIHRLRPTKKKTRKNQRDFRVIDGGGMVN